MKRTSRKSSSSQSSKAFRVVGAERVREGTAKVYVDAGRDGELWVTVYPDPLPMRVFSASSNVQWLESDLTDAQRKQVRLAASRALASNGRFKRTSRMAANAEWVTGHHFPEFKTRAAAEEWAKTKIKGQPWKVFSLQRWGGSHDRTVWKAHVQEGYAFRGAERNPDVAKKKRTSRMAANADRRWWGVWTGKEHRMNVLAPSEADAIAQFERKTRGMVFLPGGAVSARLLDEPPRGRSAPMPLPHWRPSRNPASATFPGTLSGYHAAHNWLVQHGFHPVPGSSRYEDGMRHTGRIVDAGRDYRVEVEKRLGRNPASIAESAPWRVRDRLTRHRYYFQSRPEAERFIESVSTSEITGEPLRQWAGRLVAEKNV